MFSNYLKGKYKIDIQSGLITVHRPDGEDDIEFNYDPTAMNIDGVSVVMYSKLGDDCGSMSNKCVEFTDMNGVTSETVLDSKKFDYIVIKNKIEVDTPYLYIVYDNAAEDTSSFVFVKLI
jgi:hypothetical protein